MFCYLVVILKLATTAAVTLAIVAGVVYLSGVVVQQDYANLSARIEAGWQVAAQDPDLRAEMLPELHAMEDERGRMQDALMAKRKNQSAAAFICP